MNRLCLPFGTACFLSVCLLTSSPRTAQAENRVGICWLSNQTDVTVHYQYKIGPGGRWTTARLAPGDKREYWHRYSYHDQNHSLPCYVRFDSVVGPGVYMLEHKLQFRPS